MTDADAGKALLFVIASDYRDIFARRNVAPVLQPLSPCETLALRTISVATRAVTDTLMAAIAAALDVTAESGSTTTLDRGHGAPPGDGQ